MKSSRTGSNQQIFSSVQEQTPNFWSFTITSTHATRTTRLRQAPLEPEGLRAIPSALTKRQYLEVDSRIIKDRRILLCDSRKHFALSRKELRTRVGNLTRLFFLEETCKQHAVHPVVSSVIFRYSFSYLSTRFRYVSLYFRTHAFAWNKH